MKKVEKEQKEKEEKEERKVEDSLRLLCRGDKAHHADCNHCNLTQELNLEVRRQR